MRYQLNFNPEPFEADSEFDGYEEERPDIYSEFDEELEVFDTEQAEEREEEARRGRRIPIRATRFGPRPARPPRPPGHWPPKPPWPPRPPRPTPVVILREPPSIDYPPQGTEYVSWVQSSLNRIVGLRLPVDGIIGPETRSAIRSFQAREGLPVTGIVGPDTERALIAAGASDPPETGQFLEAYSAFDKHEEGPSEYDPAEELLDSEQEESLFSSSAFSRAGATPTARMPRASAPAPETEGPRPGITGTTCPSGKGKCWKGPRSADIVDADVPWNDSSNRRAAHYDAVLDYFNVGNSKGIDGSKGPENPRYTPKAGSTYCNIYVHDVTRAMWASIPHWVRDPKQKKPPVGWNELSANRSVDWLLASGRSRGWIPIDANLRDWIRLQLQKRMSLPFADPAVTDNLRIAGERIAASPHADPRLLSQASYIAQQFANQGLPTVVVWKNPKPGRSGHVAMIRPEHNSRRGEVNKRGVFVPRSAQAGRYNWINQLAKNMVPLRNVLFFVHE